MKGGWRDTEHGPYALHLFYPCHHCNGRGIIINRIHTFGDHTVVIHRMECSLCKGLGEEVEPTWRNCMDFEGRIRPSENDSDGK